MTTLKDINSLIQTGETTTEQALKQFDELEAVDIDFMMGRWQGSGLHTNHPMDGLLEQFNWYGKAFINSEQVHPLLFLDNNNQIFKIAPSPTLMNLSARQNFPKVAAMNWLFRLSQFLFKTEQSQARLRMMKYRGKVSATMIYDYLPIHDTFRKIDQDTVLGLMDFKKVKQPFFFILKRES